MSACSLENSVVARISNGYTYVCWPDLPPLLGSLYTNVVRMYVVRVFCWTTAPIRAIFYPQSFAQRPRRHHTIGQCYRYCWQTLQNGGSFEARVWMDRRRKPNSLVVPVVVATEVHCQRPPAGSELPCQPLVSTLLQGWRRQRILTGRIIYSPTLTYLSASISPFVCLTLSPSYCILFSLKVYFSG